MTVCLTGDVHHMSLGTRDQEYMDVTEVEAALEYAEIAADYDVPVTLFLTGKTAHEERTRVRRLADMENVEVGGHDFYAFDTVVHKGWRLLEKGTSGRIGSWNGPRRFQAWEVGRTIAALNQVGVDPDCWRNHAYRCDGNTHSLLANSGISHASNAVGPDRRVRMRDGVTVVPVNTPPDHEHVYHAFRTPEFVAEHDFEGPFGSESWTVDVWADRILRALESGEGSEPKTVLAHPACMMLADDFDAFERICRTVAREHEARVVSDIDYGSSST